MEIGVLTSVNTSLDLGTQIGAALLRNSLDSIEDLGDGMQKMMEASVMPHLGQTIDYSV